jgi:hypothetical protein
MRGMSPLRRLVLSDRFFLISAGLGKFQYYSAALNTASIHMFINAKQRKAAEERKERVPLRYPAAVQAANNFLAQEYPNVVAPPIGIRPPQVVFKSVANQGVCLYCQ